MREEGKQGKHGPFAKPIKERSQGKKEGRGEVVKASRWPRIDKKTIIRERRRELVKSRRIYDLTLITPSSTTRRFTPRERRIFFPPIFFFFSLPSFLPPLKNLFSVHAIRRKKRRGEGEEERGVQRCRFCGSPLEIFDPSLLSTGKIAGFTRKSISSSTLPPPTSPRYTHGRKGCALIAEIRAPRLSYL